MPAAKKRRPPAHGSVFEKVYKGKRYKLKVLHKSGDVLYVVSGETFTAPSSAARSITGGHVNGWRFWGIDG